MTRKKIIILIVALLLIILFILGWIFNFLPFETKPDLTEITTENNKQIEVYSKAYISDLINIKNGSLVKDQKIDTSKLQTIDIKFHYWNSNHRKKSQTITVQITDTTPPYIDLTDFYSIGQGNTDNLADIIMCADNYDTNPHCVIEGTYDATQPGQYPLIFKAIDSSNNITTKPFTLTVKEKKPNSTTTLTEGTAFSFFIDNYKQDGNKIGIDVSKWQGEVDWQAVKNSGVEFVMMRLGTQKGINESSVIDATFKDNIASATKVGLDVGVYYYSYASSVKEAKQQANWVIKQLKPYDLALPVAFDWESWTLFNQLNISIYDLNTIASTFIKEVNNSGYDTLLYGSKKYLENIWDTDEQNVWLAHYTNQTTYNKKYDLWQLSSTGIVDGIDGFVDIDIMNFTS